MRHAPEKAYGTSNTIMLMVKLSVIENQIQVSEPTKVKLYSKNILTWTLCLL